jgi:hypothetical protein
MASTPLRFCTLQLVLVLSLARTVRIPLTDCDPYAIRRPTVGFHCHSQLPARTSSKPLAHSRRFGSPRSSLSHSSAQPAELPHARCRGAAPACRAHPDDNRAGCLPTTLSDRFALRMARGRACSPSTAGTHQARAPLSEQWGSICGTGNEQILAINSRP